MSKVAYIVESINGENKLVITTEKTEKEAIECWELRFGTSQQIIVQKIEGDKNSFLWIVNDDDDDDDEAVLFAKTEEEAKKYYCDKNHVFFDSDSDRENYLASLDTLQYNVYSQ